MKKILILTVTAGNGHNACARSMKDKLESLGSAEVKIVDMLGEYSTKLKYWTADRGYSLSVSKLLTLYNAFYVHYKNAPPERRYSCPSQSMAVSTVRGLLETIHEFKPDVIYSTHFYGAMAITDIKLIYGLPCKTVVSNLDYVNSPFWEAGIGVDYFAIPNEDFIEEFIREGYTRSQLLPVGLPVDERTLTVENKEEAREKFNLDKDAFTVMVMFGGGYWNGGLRIFKQLVRALKGRKAQIIMINGKNGKSFKAISKMKFGDNIKVLNVGFTEDVPSYMSCADVIINKFGGTSVTEMINKSLPMLITRNLAAQEKFNLEYMEQKGVALSFKNARQLKEHITALMDNPAKLEEMSAKTLPLRKNAIHGLAEFMLSLPNADYSGFTRASAPCEGIEKKVKQALKRADKTGRKEAALKKKTK